MTSVIIPNEFDPRPYQMEAMEARDRGCKRNIWVWHRRAGKDLTALHQTCKEMHQRIGAYWHIFPTAEQGRKAIWEGFTRDQQRIMELVFPRAIRKSPRAFTSNGEMVVTLKNGSIWRLLGSDKMEVVGAGPVGVTFSEYSLAKPNTWDLVRPMLRENDGGATFIFTPRGKNHGWKLLDMGRQTQGWFCSVRTLNDTMAYDPVKTVEEEHASGMPDELIQQEYFCDFNAANVGSFYGVSLAALEARGGLAAFEHGRDDVYTSWDLGRADDTAIWWWRIGPMGLEVLDHYASHGEDLDHYFDVIAGRQRLHRWVYRKHLLPHDAKAKTLATRQTVYEQASARLGSGMVGITPNLPLLDGIQSLRALFNLHGTRIHPRCALSITRKDCDGIEALRAYHREWDPGAKCFRETPVHDWSSHTADGARYMAVMVKVAQMVALPSHQSPGAQAALPLSEAFRMDNMTPVKRSGGRVG